MEINRLKPFPLVFACSDVDASTDYVIAIMNKFAEDLVEIYVTSDSQGNITTNLPDYFSRYDAEYVVEIYVKAGEVNGIATRGDLVWTDTLTIMRPYVDPRTIADTPDDVADAAMYESISRSLINSITGGFMYTREVVETTGLGADYLAIPFRINKIVRVYENDVIVYDTEPSDPNTWTNTREYIISPDKTSITVYMPTANGINRLQSRPVMNPRGASDSFTLYNTNDSPNFSDAIYDTKTFVDMAANTAMFPESWDYTVIIEAGWPIIPQDIKQATKLLISDMQCNNLPYINSYVTNFKSDQFTVVFDPEAFKDTGNRIVDRILSAYPRPYHRIGVL
jgi:hypothetical protein